MATPTPDEPSDPAAAPARVVDVPVGGARGALRHAIYGFLMGSADTVPGVSGGTVAFVCGIYERLIDAIRDAARAATHILTGRREGFAELRRVDWPLVAPLLAGLLTAVVTLASVLERQLEEEPVRLAGLFLGLALASALVSARALRAPRASTWVIVAVSAVATFALLGLHTETSAEAAAEASAPVWAYPLSAMVAICAMILPGVSGSFLLVTMGMYDDVLAAVNDREIGLLVLFAAGAAVGLGAFSRLLAWLIDHHHDRVVAAMIGLMIGSVRILWPWPGGVQTTELGKPSDRVGVTFVLMAVGFAAVLALVRFANVRQERVPHPG